MGSLKYLVIHCTASPQGRELTKADIIRFHTAPVNQGGRGWSRVGYSEMINLKGELINLRPYNENDTVEQNEYTFGAKGLNLVARHIVYVGGCNGKMDPKDTRTPEQKVTLKRYVTEFHKLHPNCKIIGHNEVANKACPSFNVQKWLKTIGII